MYISIDINLNLCWDLFLIKSDLKKKTVAFALNCELTN